MEGRTIFLVIVLLCTFTTVFAANCYGGSILSTVLVGGSSGDSQFNDITANNDNIFVVGQSGSYDFPYDQAYLASPSLFPFDAVLSVAPIQNISDIYNIIVSSYGYDNAFYVDNDGDMICVFGWTDSSSSFPDNSIYSSYDNYQAPFVLIMNSSEPTSLSEYLVAGDIFGVDYLSGSCSSKTGLAYLVSGSGGSGSADKRGYYDFDVRLTFINMTDGYQLNDLFFGAEGYDDYVSVADYIRRGSDQFIAIVGSTETPYAIPNSTFPVVNAFQSTKAGDEYSNDAFIWVANVTDPFNVTFRFATYFGGNRTEFISDAIFDESGNLYVVGKTDSSENFPLKNAFDSVYCGYSEYNCLFLSIFNFQGKLLMSSYLGIIADGISVEVQRLSDGGHLVYMAGYTYFPIDNPVEAYQYSLNGTDNPSDGLIKVVYVSADFTTAEVRLETELGGSDYDWISSVKVLPNNSFAVVGQTVSDDFPAAPPRTSSGNYAAVLTTLQCGAGLYAVSPSPSPGASIPPPSPPPATCQTTAGCYSVSDTTVQFATGNDGEYTPSQTIFAGTSGNVQNDVYLSVDYLSLEERDTAGNLIVSAPFPTSSYALASETQSINGQSVNVVTFSNYLLNGAGVDVINYFFEEAGSLTFAGTSIPVAAGTSKVSLRITSWDFQNPTNSLILNMALDVSPPPSGPATSTTSGNQTQYTWETDSSDCVVTTLSVIEKDGGVSTSTISVTSTTLKVTLPSFNNYLLYDPGFAVLVKDEKSSSPKEEVSPWAYVGAAIGAVVVVGAIVSVGYLFIGRKRRRTEKALSYRPSENKDETVVEMN